jgi:branched-chain amino acid aminotransferase
MQKASITPQIQKSKYIWMNGKIVEWDQAKIHVMTHALHYGTGVFEGIRAFAADNNLAVFRLHDHIIRLYESAKVLDLELDYNVNEFEKACIDLLKANDLKEDCYIRPIVFVGYSGIDLGFKDYPIEAAIIAFPFRHYFSKSGLDVCVSSWTRLYDPVTPPLAKICGNYVNSVLAKREALRNGYDEAIMLNAEGKVSEGTGENVFLVKNNSLITPPISSSILQGITRDTVVKIATEERLNVIEREVARAELYNADEIFLTGSAAGVVPVLSVDRKKVGNGEVGPITKKIVQKYELVVTGKSSVKGHEDWVTWVY